MISEFKRRLKTIEESVREYLPRHARPEFWRMVLNRYREEVRTILRESVTAAAFAEMVVVAEEILSLKTVEGFSGDSPGNLRTMRQNEALI